MLTFSRLIYPLSTQLFAEEYWQKRPLIVRDRDRDYYTEIIKTADIDRIIYSLQPDWRQMRLLKQGGFLASNYMNADGSPNLIQVYNAYQKGYTVVLYDLEKRWASLSALSRNLEDFFNHAIQVNAYLTPANSQARTPQVESEEVLILQVEGIQHWRIYQPLSPPLQDTSLDPDNLPPVAMDVGLEAGDFLYVPGGWGRESFTAAGSSLHLSVGISVYTWRDLLTALLSGLRQQTCDFRRALPAGFLNEGQIKPEQIEPLLQKLAEEANLDVAIDELKTQLLAKTPNPLPNGDFDRLDSANIKAALTRQIQLE